MTAKEFCTCTDHKCPLNPINHDRGCELCIKKRIISTLSKALQIL